MAAAQRTPRQDVVHITYDPIAKVLHVEHDGGARVVYDEVPPDVYEALRDSPSKAAVLREHVEGKFKQRDRTPKEP